MLKEENRKEETFLTQTRKTAKGGKLENLKALCLVFFLSTFNFFK